MFHCHPHAHILIIKAYLTCIDERSICSGSPGYVFFSIAKSLKIFETLTKKEAIVYVIVHALIITTSYGFHYGIGSTRKQLVVLDRGWLVGW